jgi:hypothetical protein
VIQGTIVIPPLSETGARQEMWRAGETQWMTAKREGSVDDSCKREISGLQLQDGDQWRTAAGEG